jgi:hypothetical protein
VAREAESASLPCGSWLPENVNVIGASNQQGPSVVTPKARWETPVTTILSLYTFPSSQLRVFLWVRRQRHINQIHWRAVAFSKETKDLRVRLIWQYTGVSGSIFFLLVTTAKGCSHLWTFPGRELPTLLSSSILRTVGFMEQLPASTSLWCLYDMCIYTSKINENSLVHLPLLIKN